MQGMVGWRPDGHQGLEAAEEEREVREGGQDQHRLQVLPGRERRREEEEEMEEEEEEKEEY